MRTTLTVDDDLMEALREAAHKKGIPLKRLIDRALRVGLKQMDRTSPQRYRCPTFSMGEPSSRALDLDKALALSAALEDAEIARKLELRK